jgi:hypothetical protein
MRVSLWFGPTICVMRVPRGNAPHLSYATHEAHCICVVQLYKFEHMTVQIDQLYSIMVRLFSSARNQGDRQRCIIIRSAGQYNTGILIAAFT